MAGSVLPLEEVGGAARQRSRAGRQFGEEKEESRDRGCGRGVGGEVLFSHGKLLSAHKRTIWLMLTVELSSVHLIMRLKLVCIHLVGCV